MSKTEPTTKPTTEETTAMTTSETTLALARAMAELPTETRAPVPQTPKSPRRPRVSGMLVIRLPKSRTVNGTPVGPQDESTEAAYEAASQAAKAELVREDQVRELELRQQAERGLELARRAQVAQAEEALRNAVPLTLETGASKEDQVLADLISSLIQEGLANPTGTVMSQIERVEIARATQILSGTFGTRSSEVIMAAKACCTYEELLLSEDGPELVTVLLERRLGAIVAKKASTMHLQVNKLANRFEYLWTQTLTFSAVAPSKGNQTTQGKRRTLFTSRVQTQGLITQMLEARGQHNTDKPAVLSLLNGLPNGVSEDGKDSGRQVRVDPEEYMFLAQEGYAVSKEGLAWDTKSIGWEWLVRTFPHAIDMSAYNHRLQAPLLPNGFFESIKARFHVQKVPYLVPVPVEQQSVEELLVTGMGMPVTREEMRPANVDGSGEYDCAAPEFAAFVAAHGEVQIQISFLNPESGLFCKGTLYPNAQLNVGVPEELQAPVAFDWLQVKGLHKPFAKKMAKQDAVLVRTGSMGIMQHWGNAGTIACNFEVLQQIRCTPRTTALIQELVNEAVAKIMKGGVDKFLAKIGRQDPNVQTIVKLLAHARLEGHPVNPMKIRMLARAIDERLGKDLWVVNQGAGIRGNSYVVKIDDSMEDGTIVVGGGYKPGTRVAMWRSPTLLAQGLVTAMVVAAREHQKAMLHGKVAKRTVIMNSRTIVLMMQGDDDGDTVAITSDPRVVELWSNLVDDRLYSIEYESRPMIGLRGSEMRTQDPDGLKYLQFDPRGPIGYITIWHAKLMAVGNYAAARALVPIAQECIDSAKKLPRWTDPRKLLSDNAWFVDSKGIWFPHDLQGHTTDNYFQEADLVHDDPTMPDGFPKELLEKWVGAQIRAVNSAKGFNPLGWRQQAGTAEVGGDQQVQQLRKRVAPSTMELCQAKQAGWNGGNLVQVAADAMVVAWKANAHLWAQDTQSVDLPDLIENLLAHKGINTRGSTMDWDQYQRGLRTKSGLSEFGKEFKTIMSAGHMDETVKYSRIEAANIKLHADLEGLTVEELLTIWKMEQQPRGNINHAFRAVTCPNGPIMALLGIENAEGTCKYATRTRVAGAVAAALKQPRPIQAMVEMFYTNTGHAQEVRDLQGQPVQLWQCPACQKQLLDLLTRTYRSQKSGGERKYMTDLIHRLNQYERQASPVVFPKKVWVNPNAVTPVPAESLEYLDSVELEYSNESEYELHDDGFEDLF